MAIGITWPCSHTFIPQTRSKELVKGLANDISSDLDSGAVDIIVLKRVIFQILDNLLKSISYEKT